MAPEILNGFEYNTKADIWSLGIILYEMLYGICPYVAEHIGKMIDLIYSQPLEFEHSDSNAAPVSNESQGLLRHMLKSKSGMRIDWPELFSYNFNWVNNLGEILFQPSPTLRRMRKESYPVYFDL